MQFQKVLALFKLLSVVNKVHLYSAHGSEMLKNPSSVDIELVVWSVFIICYKESFQASESARELAIPSKPFWSEDEAYAGCFRWKKLEEIISVF